MTAASLLIKITVVLLLALVAARLARRRPAAVRHVVLAAAFAALLIVPVGSALVPAVVVTVPAVVQRAIALPEPDPIVSAGGTADSSGQAHPSSSLLSAAGATALPPVSAFLLGAWLAGTIVFLLPVGAGLWQIRALRRSAVPDRVLSAAVEALAAELRLRRPVGLLLHEAIQGPMTCGYSRPAILLPTDALAWSGDDLRRALVHELEHVRRGDWISHMWARVITAAYWFHPIVWVAWRRLGLEAERACDDAVLSRSDPMTYADQLVDLARRLSTSATQPQLAMATRDDLSARVRALLDGAQRRGRAGARVVWSAAAVTILLAFALSAIRVVAAPQAPAQNAAGSRPRYDVATIRRCEAEPNPTGARGTAGGTNATFSPGRFYVPCVTTQQLIYLAYAGSGAPVEDRLVNDDAGAGSNTTKVRGGPDWVHSLREKYRVEATAEGATERSVLMGTMLQMLLEDRFKLKLHRETEEVAMYRLVVAKGGFKPKPMKEGDCTPYDGATGPPTAAASSTPVCGALMMGTANGLTRWTFGGFKIQNMAMLLGRQIGAPVIDETGLSGEYIIRLQFVRAQDAAVPAAPGREVATAAAGPDIFTAIQEQLGLKLEPTRGPRGYLVIDSIERPTPDAPVVPPARAAGPGPRQH
jgi:bla regulator protein blaR1